LKDPAQKQRLMPLLAKADIVIEQFRPGVMDRPGLGYEAIGAINPRVIYCAITGYGQTGPKRDVAGHDLNYISDTGMLCPRCRCRSCRFSATRATTSCLLPLVRIPIAWRHPEQADRPSGC
jgi:hypothetical protein